MSPTDTGRFTSSAAATHPAKPFIPPTPGEEHVWVQGDDASQSPPATGPRPSRLVTSVGVRPLPNLRPRPFDDPCNYLG